MTPLVLDASMTVSWLFEEERDHESRSAATYVATDGALVPAVWRWEFQNALRSAERRGRISERGVADALRRVAALPIAIDPVNPSIALGYELQLSRRFALTVYDAAYLDLAQRRGLLLATKDQALRESAEALGVLWTAHKQSD